MVTDLRAYSALNTASYPRFLARNDSNLIVLDTAVTAATLSGTSDGVFMLPFRPAQSPDPWMYVAAREDYQKLSTPDPATEIITARNVGLAEPFNPPQAAPMQMGLVEFSGGAGNWTNSGTAGSISDGTRTTDTILNVLPDPVFTTRCSLQVDPDKFYQIGQTLYLNAALTALSVIQDVVPPIENTYGIAIEAIYYRSGSTGACVIVPDQNSISANVPGVALAPSSESILSDPVLAGLRRGALVSLTGYYGTETVLILSVTKGPTGQFAFECETAVTFSPGDTIMGLAAIVVEHYALDDTFIGETLTTFDLEYAVTTGTATVQQALSPSLNPFTSVFYAGLTGMVQIAQLDDYVNFAINLQTPADLTIGRIIFNVGDTVDYVTDFYYAEFTAADLIKAQSPNAPPSPVGSTTPTFEEFLDQTSQLQTGFGPLDARIRAELLSQYNAIYGNVPAPSGDADTTIYPDSAWVVLQIPIRTLVHGGTNANRTLANCNGVRIELVVAANMDAKISCFWVGGGGQADVGRIGSPYYYLARPRDSRTGVKGNPSPSTRYGVSPRRQRVEVELIDTVLDPQMDTWDIYRFGGTVTSWRYLGSMPNSGGSLDTYIDNLPDTSIVGSGLLERDNFEPWPTIDIPFIHTGTSEIIGTILLLTFTDISLVPSHILRWLPGTLILVDSVAYTLWQRPTALSATEYLLETTECIGSGMATTVTINEPIIARQRLLSIFGPDAAGTVFGCGDPLRRGTLSYSKSYNPDSVPDAYNRELVQPSEPLMGGVVIDGLASVASTQRWWDLYPQFGASTGAERYQPVERGVGRGLAAPYGLCSDGKRIYFVAKDGIWVKEGSGGYSLTDADLRDLFPHEGVIGFDITYAGLVVYAPDYTRAQTFRLAYCKSYLYFDYQDIYGVQRTLVCDLSRERPAWSVDEYADPIACHYWLEGPENDLTTVSPTYPVLLMGGADNNVFIQRDLTNDNGVPISCSLATFEWNGGDVRADQFWGDGMVDALPLSGLTVTPISNRIASGVPTTVPVSETRAQNVVKSAGIEQKYLGYLIQWIDDFEYWDHTEPTTLYAWQPLYQAVPLRVFTWRTQGTTFGIHGYFHIYQVLAAYRSTAEVLLTVSNYDGTAPESFSLPSTGGGEQKILFPFSFNKGLLYFFEGTSDEPWYPYFDAWEFYVGAWGRTTPYEHRTDVEAPKGLARSIEE